MALKPLNSVGGFSVGETPNTVIASNTYITSTGALFSGNLAISNATASWGILVDNLYYSNGAPWDLQLPGGSNTQVQFNDDNQFGGSANFTFNKTTNLLTVSGNSQFNNANLGNLAIANFVNVASNTVTNNLTVNLELGGNTANFSGNINAANANLGNTASATYLGGTLTTAAQPNITSVGTLSSLSVTGNGTFGNVGGGNLVSANYVNASVNLNATGNVNANIVNASNLVVAPQLQSNIANGTTPFLVSSQTLVANLNADLLDGYNTAVSNTANTVAVRNADGNLSANYFVGNGAFLTGIDTSLISNGNSNVAVTANSNVNVSVAGNANVVVFTGTGEKVNGTLDVTGNVGLGSANTNQIVNLTTKSLEIRGGWGQTTLTSAALFAGDYANNTDWGKFSVQGNVGGNSAAITEANVSYWRTPAGVANAVTIDTLTTSATNTSTGALVVGGGVGVSGNAYIGGLLSVTGNIANANNISATNTVFANNANITSNLTSGNANLGNLAIASYVQTGEILNGNSNVVLAANGNLLVSITGSANVLKVSNVGANVVGYVQANGNGTFGALYSTTLTSNSGALTLAPAAGNENIILAPTGTGTVDVSSKRITSVTDPTSPQDAATKAYVDSVAQGLTIHTAVRVTSATNLNATYANGGGTLTTIAITGGKTIQFSAAHGLSVGDEIAWDNTFNGITGDQPYFVYSTPASDTITVKDSYFGSEVTTLTNGSGLSQTARYNTGVGATLTNAGANAALSIDGITLSSSDRVLVQGQTSGLQNGVYTVTTVGNGSTAWVLTRATDENTYIPGSTTGLAYGSYFFISQGTSYAGSSYVLTDPVGEILFGYTSIGFTQFSAAGSYTAGSGINITGTTISANTDGVTTDIVSGNIVVKASAQLTTPNIGAATGTSVDLSGNVLAGNINANAKVTAANIEATSDVLANNFSANSNVTANNVTVNLALGGNTANFSGNVTVNNLTVNLELAGNSANFSGNIYADFVQAGVGNIIPNLTNPLFSGIANANNFIQAYIHNESNGTAASADFIAYPNNGDDVSGWIDMGITSNTFNAASYSVTEENEGYIFMSAPDLSGTSGNLVFATDSTGANNSIEFFVGGFSQAKNARQLLISNTGVTVTGNLTSANANLGNLAVANFFQGDGGLLTNVAASGSLSNGNSSVTIPVANGNINMTAAGNANVVVVTGTGANVTGTLGVSGNADVGNLGTAGLITSANLTVNLEFQANTANFDGNVVMDNWLTVSNIANVGTLRTDNLQYANGTAWDLQEAAGAATQVQYNDGSNNFGASANFTYNDATQLLTVTGNSQFNNANLGNLAIANFVNVASNTVTSNLTVNLALGGNTANFSGNVISNNFTVNLELQGNTANFDGNVVMDNWLTVSNIANVGTLRTNNLQYANGTPWDLQEAAGANTQIQYNLGNNFAASANFTYDDATQLFTVNGSSNVAGTAQSGNAKVSSLSSTHIVYANSTQFLVGSANFTFDPATNQFTVNGNGQFNNANLGNLATANFVNVASNVISNNVSVNLELAGNTANFSGNVILANLTANGNVAGNNVNVSNTTTTNTLTVNNAITGNTANFSGNVVMNNATVNLELAGNTANFGGNVIAANFVGALANGNTNIKVYSNANVEISVTGTANTATFASTGLYVVGEINTTAGNMLSNGNVTANGFLVGANANVTGEALLGSVKTANIVAPTGNITISAAGSDKSINLVPTGNGTVDVANTKITNLLTPTSDYDAATKKYVDDVAQGLNVHDSCYAATANTLANLTGGTITYNNGTGGVGANLVLSGSPTKNFTSANCFDGNTTAVATNRILVKNEANAAHNGIYVVTSSTVLTRATDYDSVPEVEAGDFVFVQDGDTYNDTGWVQTSSVTTIGTDNIVFTQFSGAGTYTAGNGIALNGTVFSANVDGVTTAIVSGNIVVKSSANLTTPNVGDATFQSLSWNNAGNGNVTANNLSIGNLANITGNLTVAGNIVTTYNITSNANIYSNNSDVTNFLTVGANITGNNISSNNLITTANANISANLVTSNATINLALSGNTANFTGNIVAANANLGNLVTANFFTGTLVNGTSNVAIPSTNGNINLTAAGNTTLVVTGTGANISGTANITGNIVGQANLNLSSDLFANNLQSNNNVTIGNTAVRWSTATTTAITANQTIATLSTSGITGYEFIVKGTDSSGGKYTMAIVTAVTDGSNVDYSTFGGVTLGSTTGTLAVNLNGSNIELQVTPASTNSTVWTTQYRTI